MNYRIKHITEYKYQFPASLCHNLICQGPALHEFQEVLEHELKIDPVPRIRETRRDFFDNGLTYFSIEHTHNQLLVEADSLVRVLTPGWMHVRPSETENWESVVSWLNTTAARNDTRQFYLESPYVRFLSEITEYSRVSFTPGRPIMEAVLDLCNRIYHDFTFTPGFTEISTPIETVFEHRKGVCQDYAHFALSCIRSLGLAARYVSGYIETLPPPGKPKLFGVDASHAWFSVLVPEAGWVEFDATNNLLVNDQHIRAAYGRDFSDVVPLKGIVYSGGKQEMVVKVDVRRET